MKFARNLATHITPEWRKQYVEYEEMKAMILYALEIAPSPTDVPQTVITRHFAVFKEEFFQFAERELIKVNTFFSEKMAEASLRAASLKTEVYNLPHKVEDALKKKTLPMEKLAMHLRHFKDPKKPANKSVKIHDLKFAYSEFYLSLVLLQNYQDLNFQSFRKIFKKFDKLLCTDEGAKWRVQRVENAPFYISKDINKLIRDTERTVTRELYDGDRHRAMKRLRVPPLSESNYPWITFSVGLFFGASIILFILVIISGVCDPAVGMWHIVYRLYRGPFLIIEFLLLIGLNIYGWRRCGVNYVLIFELNPRQHLSEQHLMVLSGIFAVLWAFSVLAFQYSSWLSIPAYSSPLALIVIMLLFLFNPTKTMFYHARIWLLNLLFRVVTAPYFPVGFADFWFADQLNSLSPALVDFNYVICFYYSGINWYNEKDTTKCITGVGEVVRPIVACLPAWFRFAQCNRRYWETKEAFPHLANAAKYSTTFFNVIFSSVYAATKKTYGVRSENPFFYLWIISAVTSSLYSYIWDIKMDWGLFDKNAHDNPFLREEIVYPMPCYYYFAIVEDLVLRFMWALSVSLTELGLFHTEVMVCVLAPLEVIRRFLWNFLRLENEHLNNCGKFRAVRDISIAPLGTDDPSHLIDEMDEEDGVPLLKRRKQKQSLRNHLLSSVKLESSSDIVDTVDEENSVIKRRSRQSKTYQEDSKSKRSDTSILVERNANDSEDPDS